MGRKLTQNEFLERANKIHNNKYDYSLVEYKKSNIKIEIICPEHNNFYQQPHCHLNGQGCPRCSGKMKKTKEEFIAESNKIHNNKYNYSLVEYKNNKNKVKIICPEHGIFEQRVDMHTQGHGCDKCGGTYNLSTNEFINRANKRHKNKYDYSLVNYVNSSTKIKISCPKHGVFEQVASEHLVGKGCGKCANKHMTTKDFIEKAKIVHGNIYDYSLVNYKNNKTKIKIICPEHGIFEQIPHYHLGKCGCPICNESFGERKITDILKNCNIKFKKQKTFEKCKNINLLPFDFYLLDYNCCIEFDGKQHYEPNNFFGGEKEFLKLKERDKIKNNFCKNHKIKLFRIKYNKNIDEKMKIILAKMYIIYNP